MLLFYLAVGFSALAFLWGCWLVVCQIFGIGDHDGRNEW
jgi:hypothetical protein